MCTKTKQVQEFQVDAVVVFAGFGHWHYMTQWREDSQDAKREFLEECQRYQASIGRPKIVRSDLAMHKRTVQREC